jgi:hypothetical protein
MTMRFGSDNKNSASPTVIVRRGSDHVKADCRSRFSSARIRVIMHLNLDPSKAHHYSRGDATMLAGRSLAFDMNRSAPNAAHRAGMTIVDECRTRHVSRITQKSRCVIEVFHGAVSHRLLSCECHDFSRPFDKIPSTRCTSGGLVWHLAGDRPLYYRVALTPQDLATPSAATRHAL